MVGFACAPDNEPAIAPEPEVEVEVCDQAPEPVTIATMPIVAQSLFMMMYPVQLARRILSWGKGRSPSPN
jgi:hypothetical protein